MQSKYELGIGGSRSTCATCRWPDTTHRIHAQLGIGELIVDVPSTVRVDRARARRARARSELFGEQRRRLARATDAHRARHREPGVLDLDLRVGAGDIVVRRFDATGRRRDRSLRTADTTAVDRLTVRTTSM